MQTGATLAAGVTKEHLPGSRDPSSVTGSLLSLPPFPRASTGTSKRVGVFSWPNVYGGFLEDLATLVTSAPKY